MDEKLNAEWIKVIICLLSLGPWYAWPCLEDLKGKFFLLCDHQCVHRKHLGMDQAL